MTIHLHAPPPTIRSFKVMECPDCGRVAMFLRFFTPWYGDSVTCLRCGRHWEDGEWIQLPFVRGARKRSIESAKRIWRRMRWRGVPISVG
ncbi:MAG: hypothetical protein KC940_26645 [Candidatus Omnitrophica bacterium]|nr:hypothetical protein [Candidatus Omnitrophota bacterium]